MPYNDGSQLTLQVFAREQLDRERHNVEAYQLGAGTGIRVEAVPRGQREEALRLARSSRRGQAGHNADAAAMAGPADASASLWEALGTDTPHTVGDARRHSTDITASGAVTRTEALAAGGSVSRSLSRAPRARSQERLWVAVE